MNNLKEYAVKAITEIIPLDHETCLEMVDYVLTLTSDVEIQNHFLGFLGEGEKSLSFIHEFISMKNEIQNPKRNQQNSQREKYNETHLVAQKKKERQQSPVWGKGQGAVETKPDRKNTHTVNKLKTTSQLLKSKEPESKQTTTKKAKKRNLDNLKDIESILNDLEINDNNDADVIRVCNCMATRHPLFEVTPNCLNCGKIICAREGLQPCSYCGSELLSVKEKNDIKQILTLEREGLEDKKPKEEINALKQSLLSAVKQKNKKIVISMRAGENLWAAQDRALKQADNEKKKNAERIAKEEEERKEIEDQEREFKRYERTQLVEPALLAAQEKLETLLNFQATGAERTRIIDNASDFDAPGVSSGSMWLSPIERALQLKKQQRQMRKQKDGELNRTGRGKKIVEMVIKNGKVEMIEKQGGSHHVGGASIVSDEEDGEDIKELEEQIKKKKNQDELKVQENVWDYERDSTNWEKPTYLTTESVNTTEGMSDERLLRPRVQFFNDSETNELLA